MQIEQEITIADIDEALNHLRLKIEDKYGNRLRPRERDIYLSSIDDLLDARNALAVE